MNMLLSQKERWFVERMLESEHMEQWGFELLKKQPGSYRFFATLRERGLLTAERNPAPRDVGEGRFHVPYWAALDYLELCAKHATEVGDTTIVGAILNLIREVARRDRATNNGVSNYNTNAKFAEILGILPRECIDLSFLDEVLPVWLKSRFDRGLVASEFASGLVPHLLQSEQRAHGLVAIRILDHCLSFEMTEVQGRSEPKALVEDFWLRSLLEKSIDRLVSIAPEELCEVLIRRLSEFYAASEHHTATWLLRPAIEEHPQNHEWGELENRLVEASRDALVLWIDRSGAALDFFRTIASRQDEIVRRLSIHLIDVRFPALEEAVDQVVRAGVVELGALHEAYGFLKHHFEHLPIELQSDVLRQLRCLSQSVSEKLGHQSAKYVEKQWLSAIANTSNSEAAEWYARLLADRDLGPVSEHPDFHSYMESFTGPGPSPYSSSELTAFAQAGTLPEKLNAFVQEDRWRGPSRRALVDTLEEAIARNPTFFAPLLARTHDLQIAYVYGLLNGFKRLWESSEVPVTFDWASAWPLLFDVFEDLLLSRPELWEMPGGHVDLEPTGRWIPSLLSEFIRSGTRNDERSFSIDLGDRALQCLRVLLSKSAGMTEPSDDPMTRAINTERGRAIEAFFSHALRLCRSADRVEGGLHQTFAARIRPDLDAELERAEAGASFEFFTLAAAYIANLQYVDSTWVSENMGRLFPVGNPVGFGCALAGLAFAPATRSIYELLRNAGTVEAGIALGAEDRIRGRRLLERVALAYLWGAEELDGPLFQIVLDFERGTNSVSVVAGFLASIDNKRLDSEQRNRVLRFLEVALEKARRLAEKQPVMGRLARLLVHLPDAKGVHGLWLVELAPFGAGDTGRADFFELLMRLLSSNASAVAAALKAHVSASPPNYDHRDVIYTLVKAIYEAGLQTEAVTIANQLAHLSSMRRLNTELDL